MKTTKYFTLRKAIGVAAAGKLALGASAVSAQTDFTNCGFGKGGEECEPQENEVPPLFLQEFGSPMRILTPPGNDFDWDHIGYDPVGDDSGKGGGGSDMMDPNMEPQLRQGDPSPDGGPDGGKNTEDSIDPMDPEAGILWAGAVQRLLRCNGEEIQLPPPEESTRQGDGGKDSVDADGSGNLEDEELPQDLRCPPAGEGPPPRPRMEFMIEGVRNDQVMAVILAYSTKRPDDMEGNRGLWQGMLGGGPIRNGQMELDLGTLKIIAGIRVDPENAALGDNPPTPLGKIPPMRTRSIKIPVDLSALNDPSLMHNHLFFQAIAVPLDPAGGGFIMPESQASEVDHFVIERPDFNNLEGDCGSKGCDDDMHGGFKPD
ncbi:MAG: hypothetical protein GY862_18735, partial [Gammaproteobacteria bacterium]|nr:hypothetical protein [Gammaproteobacteria bacterium]